MKNLGSTLFILGVLAFGLNYMKPYPKSWPGFTNGAKIPPCGLKQALQAAALYCGWQAISLKTCRGRSRTGRGRRINTIKGHLKSFRRPFLYLRKTVPTLMSESMPFKARLLWR